MAFPGSTSFGEPRASALLGEGAAHSWRLFGPGGPVASQKPIGPPQGTAHLEGPWPFPKAHRSSAGNGAAARSEINATDSVVGCTT